MTFFDALVVILVAWILGVAFEGGCGSIADAIKETWGDND